MAGAPQEIRLSAILQRKDPRLPVYVVIPGRRIASWQLGGTTVIEGSANGHDFARRTIKAWGKGSDDWFVEFTAPFCRNAALEVGCTVALRLRRADAAPPTELDTLLTASDLLSEAWSLLSDRERREAAEHVRSAKLPATRQRRAGAVTEALRLRWKDRHSRS